MTTEDRDRIRELQDRLLGHPRTQRFIDTWGADASLLDGGAGPTATELRQVLCPEYEGMIQSMMTEWETEAR